MKTKRLTEAIDRAVLDPLMALVRWVQDALPKQLFEIIVALIVGYVVARLMLRNVMFGVGLITAMICMLLLLRRPYWVVYGALAFIPLHWMRLLGDRVRIVSFLSLVAFLYYLFSSMIERRKINERIFWLYLGFMFMALISIADSGQWHIGYHYLRMYIFALMFAFAAIMCIDDVSKLRTAVKILVAWGIAESLLGVLQSLVSVKFFPSYYFGVFGMGVVKAYAVQGIFRASGTFESGPRYAMFVMLPMALALCYFYSQAMQRRGMWLLVLSLHALAILVSFTRAAYGMVFLLFLIYFLTERRRELAYKAIFYTLSIGLLFSFVLVLLIPEQINDAVEARMRFETGGTYKDRIYFGYNGFMAFLENPLLGIGPGMYNGRSWEFMQRFVVPWESVRWEVGALEMPQNVAVHNAYIRIMAENGILGIVFYALIFLVSFRDLFKVIRSEADPWMIATARGVMIYLTIMLPYWFFHEYIVDEAYVAILPIVLATILRRVNDRLIAARSPDG
ncbi:MAG: O-antigen ligase family protein [Candidatus Alcyoniella australis]|nr:O-antigen ligase family protein [Candidatus Alcyoniella australis]